MVTLASKIDILKMIRYYLHGFSPGGFRYFSKWLRNERIHCFNDQLRINSFIPPWPSEANKRLKHAAFSKERIPYQVYYAITPDCPCHCAHCSYLGRDGIDMTTDQSIQFLQQVKDIGCASVGFTGGEPLLRNDLEVLIAMCKPEMSTILFTTGHGLNKARALALKKAELDWFTVGIETTNEKEHDRIRQHPGSFQKGKQALLLARKVALYTAISTVATKEKIHSGEIERLYRFADDLDVGELRIIPLVATGGYIGRQDCMLSDDEYQYLKEFHISKNKRKMGPVVESFSYIESNELFGCGAGFHHFFVDATGNVCPCDLTPLSFGNVLEEALIDIWKRKGKYFSQPRCGCLMKSIAPLLPEETQLPINKEHSPDFVPRISNDQELPRMYQYLKKGS